MAERLCTTTVVFFRVVQILVLLRLPILMKLVHKENLLFKFVQTVTEPILSPIRRIIDRSVVGKYAIFDFSPVLAFVLIGYIEYIILLIIKAFI